MIALARLSLCKIELQTCFRIDCKQPETGRTLKGNGGTISGCVSVSTVETSMEKAISNLNRWFPNCANYKDRVIKYFHSLWSEIWQ